MEKSEHVDLRVQKTVEAIKTTFREMVLEMDAGRITVRELADRARIHRKTFYLHYTCIEALAEDVIADLAQSYFDRIDAIDPDMPIDQTNRVFFEFMRSKEGISVMNARVSLYVLRRRCGFIREWHFLQ